MTEADLERAVGYTRLSQDGKSLESQRDQIERYCTEHGLELQEVYSDGEQSSGYTSDREAYQGLLEDVTEADVEHVVVRDRSRLSRDAPDRVELLIEMHRRGQVLHVVETDERVDLSESYALTRESAQADADDVEKRKEAERGKAEAERRVELGLPIGRPPYGLEYNEDKTALVGGDGYEDALEVLELRDDQGRSWRAIEDATGVNKDTARRLYERRELYERTREPRETTKPTG